MAVIKTWDNQTFVIANNWSRNVKAFYAWRDEKLLSAIFDWNWKVVEKCDYKAIFSFNKRFNEKWIDIAIKNLFKCIYNFIRIKIKWKVDISEEFFDCIRQCCNFTYKHKFVSSIEINLAVKIIYWNCITFNLSRNICIYFIFFRNAVVKWNVKFIILYIDNTRDCIWFNNLKSILNSRNEVSKVNVTFCICWKVVFNIFNCLSIYICTKAIELYSCKHFINYSEGDCFVTDRNDSVVSINNNVFKEWFINFRNVKFDITKVEATAKFIRKYGN